MQVKVNNNSICQDTAVVASLSEAETACQKWGGSAFMKWGVI